jgi:hypothetical protein
MTELPLWQVRVTRSTDDEYANLEVRAETKEQAIELAIADAAKNEAMYFGDAPAPRFFVDMMDEPELVPPGGFA